MSEPSSGDSSKDPPRVLVVSYHFPPDSAIGGRRWGGIVKYLAREGWQFEVLCGSSFDQAPRAKKKNVRMHSLEKSRTLNDLYLQLSSRFKRENDEPSGGAAPRVLASGVNPLRRIFQRIRAGFALALKYPDHSRGWILKAAIAARRLVSRADIDIVVSSGPPHTAHLVALLATVGSRVPWVVDMRDPWLEVIRQSNAPAPFGWITSRLERLAFKRATQIVCNTREFADTLARRGLDTPVVWIPNAVDLEKLPKPAPPPTDAVNLAYVGTLYFNRDLGPVIRAMDRFLGAHGEPERRLKLRFAGHVGGQHAATLDHQLAESGLDADHVERLGRVPLEEARKVLQEAHLGIVLAQDQPMQIPAKLYETLGMGVQTLVLAESGSASANEAERLGALWREPDDIDGIVDILERLYRGEIASNFEASVRFDYEHVARQMGRVLEDVARR